MSLKLYYDGRGQWVVCKDGAKVVKSFHSYKKAKDYMAKTVEQLSDEVYVGRNEMDTAYLNKLTPIE